LNERVLRQAKETQTYVWLKVKISHQKKSTHVFTDAKKIQSNQRSQHSPHRQTPSANNAGLFSLKPRTSWDIFTGV